MGPSIPLLFLLLAPAFGFYPKQKSSPGLFGNNFGVPLFLTGYLERGRAAEGRELARVSPSPKGAIESYSGYLTVDKAHNSNIFFWYFPCEKGPAEKAPLVVWLQGGPGASSMYGLFDQVGPFYVKIKRGLKLRDHYWSQEMNVVFFESPVGTGFSFTGDNGGYAREVADVGPGLYAALGQLIALFPELAPAPLYVHGHSVGAKFALVLAHTLLRERAWSGNLRGVILGSPWLEPPAGYSDWLWWSGLVGPRERAEVAAAEARLARLIASAKWRFAADTYDSLIIGSNAPSLFNNLTNYKYYLNLLDEVDEKERGELEGYLQKDVFRRSTHVGNLTFFDENHLVEDKLRGEVMKSSKTDLERALEAGLRVLIYVGHLDPLTPAPLLLDLVWGLRWSGAAKLRAARAVKWEVDNRLAGHVLTAPPSLTFVTVRTAGHLVPTDQPKWALDMVTRFTKDQAFP